MHNMFPLKFTKMQKKKKSVDCFRGKKKELETLILLNIIQIAVWNRHYNLEDQVINYTGNLKNLKFK